MQYPIFIQGMEGRNILLVPPTWTKSAQIIVDGYVAPVGVVKNQRILVLNSGQQIVAELAPQYFDPLPKLSINGFQIPYAQPFAWYDWIVVGSPMLLIFAGGFLGGLIGGFGAMTNGVILRSSLPAALRYIFALGLGGAAWIVFAICALAFQGMLHHH